MKKWILVTFSIVVDEALIEGPSMATGLGSEETAAFRVRET